MKNFLTLLMVSILCFAIPAFAAEKIREDAPLKINKKVIVDQKLISEIGFKMLNANKIDKRMVFTYSTKDVANAQAAHFNREIVIYKGLVKYMETEDELAAIIGHEISHAVDSYDGICRGLFEIVPHWFIPRKYERKADLRSIDYMVNAGYNPVAMIVIMNKSFGQNRYEVLGTHPLPSRRLAMVYEYIYTKYPAYLVNNAYIDNIYYQNFLLNSEHNRKKLEEKVKSGSKKKIRYDY